VRGQLHAPVAFLLGKNAGTRCAGGCLGARAILDVLEKGEMSWSCRDSNPWSSGPYFSPYTIIRETRVQQGQHWTVWGVWVWLGFI